MEQYGLWPTALKQYRSTLAAGAGLGGHQACPITPIEIGLVPEQAQQFRRDSGFHGGHSRILEGNSRPARPCSQGVQTHHFRFAEYRWRRADGPSSSVIVTLIDLRSTAHEPDKWKSSPGDLWETAGGSGHSDPGRGVCTRTAHGEGQSQFTHGCFRLKARSGYVWFPRDSWLGCRGKSCVAKQES